MGAVGTSARGAQVHLVLGAGGVKCISYAGAIPALVESGLSFASVSGISAGSLAGAILCSRVGVDGFRKAVGELDLSRLGEGRSRLSLVAMLRSPFALYRETRVAQTFREIVGGDPTFEELEIPFATFGVELRSHRIHVYSRASTPRMKVSEALRISTAVPFMFPLQRENENLMLDGAVVSKSPVWLATMHGDELPIVVLRPKKQVALPPPRSAVEYLTSLIDLGGGSRDDYLIQQMPRVRLIEIDTVDVTFDQFDLSSDMRDSLIRSGRAAAEASLPDLWDDLQRGPYQPRRATTPSQPAPSSLDPAPGTSVDTAAESGADRAMNSLASSLSVRRDQVFISYSHRNKDWLHRFQDALKPFIRSRAMTLWDDTQIQPGGTWAEEIRKAMASAKVAVLLVTIEYMASDFIADVELQAFLRASKQDGLRILWVAVGASAWKKSALVDYQSLTRDPDGLPLDKMDAASQNQELVRICEEIEKALQS
jgi:predicted acylesterase/phospholipase RssA